MAVHIKLLDLKQFVRNKLHNNNTAAYHKIKSAHTIGLETGIEEMFIGSTFSSDLRDSKKKHFPENSNALQKRIGIASIKEPEGSEIIMQDRF